MSEMTQHSGVLFANANHHLIFLNKTLKQMLNLPDTPVSLFIGKPVHEILGMSVSEYESLATRIINLGRVDDLSVEIQSRSGEKLSVVAQGMINKDNNGKLVGIDYQFHMADAGQIADTTIAPLSVDMAHEIVRFYFKRQMEGLYEVMMQWGGKQFGSLLNDVFNETARVQQWRISMADEKISDSDSLMRLDMYLGLLYKSASYVSKVLGTAVMQKQIKKVNDQTNPTTFDYIEKDWYTKL